MQTAGQVYASHGSWYHHGWHNCQFFDRLNLSLLLNLSAAGHDGGNGHGNGGGLLGL